jgi:hypothetical protein
MRIRGRWLIVTIVALVLLVIGGTVSAMALAQSGLMGKRLDR